ncbi:MAG: dihydroorotase [Candidatus Paceibacter sp.]|jgi:dihydroorotase|nr:dihydroorotase [Candidatus Paceibacter sp.]
MDHIDEVKIPRWFERHLHIRDGVNEGDMMYTVLPYTLRQRPTGAVLMGNLEHPYETSTIEKTQAYARRVRSLIPAGCDFDPLFTCYMTDDISPQEVVAGYKQNVWGAVKLYLADKKGKGGTTNSQHGVRDLVGRYPVLESMAEHDIPFLTHCEAPDADVDEFDREIVGLERYIKPALKAVPGLRVVIEHVGDGRVADFVAGTGYNVRATVTIQGMKLNRNALFQGGLCPGHWYKPVAKREEHRLKVRQHVMSGNPRFGAGTDSAPHREGTKTRYLGCNAGIFTAFAAVEEYTQMFDEDNALEHLGNFMSVNFVDWYGRKVSEEMMTLKRLITNIPERICSSLTSERSTDIVVFRGGQTVLWKLVD